jgi:hypothetical protein
MAKKKTTQSPGEADKDFVAVLKQLSREGSGSGSDMRKKRRVSVNNLSGRGGPTSG